MANANGDHTEIDTIDKRDFDANRPFLVDGNGNGIFSGRRRRTRSESSRISPLSNGSDEFSDGLLSNVVDGIVDEDRRKLKLETVRICSFIWGVVCCLCAGSITAFSLYGHLFLNHLHYTQLRVNGVSIAAEVAMYTSVPFIGYLCDRYSPSPLLLFSAIFFCTGYLLAAFSYRSGPPPDVGGSGWSFWVMILAFVLVGTGTSCMYLGALTTCAKNFGRGKYRGVMLAVPIAAFGLSGMWQSQVGTYLLCERLGDGSCGDLDVFRYFLFLAFLLLATGLLGAVGLRVVDEEEEKYIDEAVSELERSGIIGEDEFFRPREEIRAAYGTFQPEGISDNFEDEEEEDGLSVTLSDEELRLQRERDEEERRKKNWLLNQETRLFLKDHTMWWLATGFFLITGPGEAYINNLGTIIQTLTPASYPFHSPPPAGLPSTHVATIALTSTASRLLTGSLSDVFAPPAMHHYIYSPENPNRQPLPQANGLTFSRLIFLLPCTTLLSLGFLLLATPLILHHPQIFHLTSALVGIGYGGAFSLVPIIISVVWGVENFGTNWGIVAIVPAAGAALWGIVYSYGYQNAADEGGGGGDGQCLGWKCYGFWAMGCTLSVWGAILALTLAWRGWRRRGVVV